jgi:protein involved in polysaccharide export with SLBB domain
MCAMSKRWLSLGIVVAFGLLLSGCYTDFGPVAAQPDPIPVPAAANQLQLGERLTITVYDEPTLTGVYDINPAGVVVMPLIGSVKAVGRTPSELARVITDRFKRGKFLEQPKVTVVVVEFKSIYIFGEVARPGQYPYQSGLNVLSAITTAGGLTYRGSKDTVLIQHAGQPVWNEYPLLSSVTVLPGDLIRVPERYF